MKKLVCLLAAAIAGVFVSGIVVSAAASNPQEVVQEQKAKKDYRTAKFNVSLTCQNCVNKVSENISFEKGVKGLDIKLEDKTVAVIYDASKTDEQKIAEAIRKLGYEVTPVVEEKPDNPQK